MRGIRPDARNGSDFEQPIQRFVDAAACSKRDGGTLRLTARGVMLSNEVFQEFLDRMIDLRSDTVTKPTPAMRRAMAEAEVGDDVYGEDPTVNRLEQRAAEIAGKEAALFVPTGTMGNTIGIKLHTHHGQEVICDARAHMLDWELSMLAWFSGCVVAPFPPRDGILRWSEIKKQIRPFGPHRAPRGCIEIENTSQHGRRHGLSARRHRRDLRRSARTRVESPHGWRARVQCRRSLRQARARIVSHVDTVMFCLSKALGAPVGSMLAGTRRQIAQARLTASGWAAECARPACWPRRVVALEETPDEARGRSRKRPLSGSKDSLIPGILIDLESVASNIVIFDIAATGRTPAAISTDLKASGVLLK